MLFLQTGPPDTTAYMIAGYVVIFGVILVYLASLVVRRRNLKQDLELLEELDERGGDQRPNQI
jgi:CcmD family protein